MIIHPFSSDPEAQPKSLMHLLRFLAAKQGEQIGFSFGVNGDDDFEHLSYGQLHQKAISIATQLQSNGATGQRVLLLYPPGLDFVAGFFGCIYAGAIAVPAYAPRLSRSFGRIQAIARDCGSQIALTASSLTGKVGAQFEGFQVLATRYLPEANETSWKIPDLTPASIALLQYTSGSTGSPKGVILSHENLLTNAAAQIQALDGRSTDRVVTWTPMFHDMGFMVGVVQPCWGIRMFGMSPTAFTQQPIRWLRAISEFRGTVSGGPNFAYELCAATITEEEKKSLDLRCWRVAFNGAEPVRADTIKRFSKAFEVCGFRPETMAPCYGLAEATLMVSVKNYLATPVVSDFSGTAIGRNIAKNPELDETAVTLVSSGSHVPGTEIVIADPDTLASRPERTIGEIWVRGPSVAQGYWGRLDESKDIFDASLSGTGEGGFLRTGDLGFLDRNELYVTGRLKDLIIIRGTNHYPQDIEYAVGTCHAALIPGAGAAFQVTIDSEDSLVIVQELGRRQRDMVPATITETIRRTVAQQFDLQPGAIVLISQGTVCRTSSGKIQRHACKQEFLRDELKVVTKWVQSKRADKAEQGTSPDRPPSSRTRVELEAWLTARLAELLNINESSIDTHRPFAEYGLDSKDAVGLSGELERYLGRRLPADLLYEYPSIAALSQFVGTDSRTAENASRRSSRTDSYEPIAVVGMGARFPGANDLAAYWDLLKAGTDAITEVPASRWRVDDFYDSDAAKPGKANTRWGGFLTDIDLFDAGFFGISGREAEHMDPQHRLVLEVAWQALADAGLKREDLVGANGGTFIGISTSEYGRFVADEMDGIGPYLATGNAASIAANRLSYYFDWRGPSLAIDTACSSSLVAIDTACRSIRDGVSEFAIAGGVNLILSPALAINFSKAGLMSPDGRCKSFDAAADGFVRSEGVGMVVLKRLSDAIANNDRIYCTIRATGVNQDGRSNGLMAPKRESQVTLLNNVYRQAGLDPSRVTLVEAHGSGTILGDSMELSALAEVLGGRDAKTGERFLGSVKSNIGHAEAAAGAAGFIKAALSLHFGQIPPSVHFHEGNPHTPPSEFGFVVPTRLRDWPLEQGRSAQDRIAAVSSFGFGGTNAHLVLEGYEPSPASELPGKHQERGVFLLPVSGHSQSALRAQIASYARHLVEPGLPSIDDICYTACARQTHHRHRVAVVGASAEELRERCNALVRSRDGATYQKAQRPGGRRKRAFVFAGHGAQHATMGRGLYEKHPQFRAVIEAFDRALEPHASWSLTRLMSGEVAAGWNDLEMVQPALLAIESGLAAVWRSWGVEADAVVGVSMGEIAAAHIAGILSVDEAVRLTCTRAKLLKQIGNTGGMLMTALAMDEAEGMVRDTRFPNVSVGICSSPHSTVLSGNRESLAGIRSVLEHRNIFARMVDIPYAPHSPEVDRIRESFFASLAGLQTEQARIPIYSTVTGRLGANLQWDTEHWWNNLRSPVLFTQAIDRLLAEGIDTFIEVSPHPVHSSSILETVHRSGKDALVVTSLRRGQDEFASMLSGAAALFEAGDSLDWSGIAGKARCVSPPAYSFQRERFWFSSKKGAHVTPTHAMRPAENSVERAVVLDKLQVMLGSLLGIDAGRVDVYTPFLEMGADSIVLLNALEGLQREFGVKLSIRQFFEQYTTVDALAGYILQVRGSESQSRAPELPVSSPMPPVTQAPPIPKSSPSSSVENVLAGQLSLVSQTISGQLQLLNQLHQGMNAPAQTVATVAPANVKSEPAVAPFIPYTPIRPGTTGGLNERQQSHLRAFTPRYIAKTALSKNRTQEFRSVLADNRASAGFRYSIKEMLYPIQAERSKGSRIVDVDGNEYIDLTMGFGVNLFGHGAPFINEALQHQLSEGMQLGPQSREAGDVARLVSEFTGFERITFCNSGTEAIMMAVRLARTATGRSKIALFAGSYHGTYDGVIARSDPQRGDASAPFAPGILPGAIEDVIVLEYGDPASLDTIRRHARTLAAVLVEPVQSRRPDLQPKSYLHELRELTKDHGIALVFDEVITGFRLALGGAQEWFGVRADLATYGKILGGGMPIGVVAGSSRYMDGIDGGVWNYGDLSYPAANTTFFAGTFCKHPLALAAAKAVLQELRKQGSALYTRLNETTSRVASELNGFFDEEGTRIKIVHCGSLFRFAYTGNLDLLFYHLLDQGVYIWEGRNCFLSTAHTAQDVDAVLSAVKQSVRALQEGDFLPAPQLRDKSASNGLARAVESVPLEEAHKQIWTVSRMDGEASIAYHVPVALELLGGARQQDLRRAVEMVIDRHRILSARIDDAGESFVFDSQRKANIAFVDVREALKVDGSALEDILNLAVREPFDLTAGPLFRVKVFTTSSSRDVLLAVGHHVAVDGISMAIVLDEIGKCYSSLAMGAPVTLAPAPQFGEAKAASQKRTELADEDAERFWKSRLGTEPPVIDLPSDFTRPSLKTYGVWFERAQLPDDVLSALKEVARRNSCSLFMTLFACFGAYLHRLTGVESMVIGIPAADREGPEEQLLVGNRTNVFPVPLQVSSAERFTDLQAKAKTALLDVFDHIHYPFSQLIRKLGIARDVSRSPLVDVMFNLDRVTKMDAWHGLHTDLIPVSSGAYPFDLHLNAIETPSALKLELQVNRDLFTHETAVALLSNFCTFVRSIAFDSNGPVGQMDLLGSQARSLVIHKWNDTVRGYPADRWIHELFADQAKKAPEATAVIFEEQSLTYQGLDRAAERLAQRLRAKGAGPEIRVGVCLERSFDLVIALLAVLKTGAAYVPFDPEYPLDRLKYMVSDSQAAIVVTTGRLAPKVSPSSAELIFVDREWSAAEAFKDDESARLDGSNAAYVIYTSGSTGRPKGAINTHAGILNRLQWMQEQYSLTEKDRVLQKTPFSFDVSVWEFFWPLMVGATLVLAKPGGHQDPDYIAGLIAREGVTVLHFVPSMLAAFLQFSVSTQCASLRHIVCSGEALPPAVAASCLDRLHGRLHNLYGPTEASVDVSYFECVQGLADETVSIGRPIANTQLYILNDSLEPVPVGSTGELYIGGIGIGRGYLNRPDATAERFIPDPFGNTRGSRLYRTGDLARWGRDGNIFFLGRADYQVKIRGFRVELGEIETALLNHASVAGAAVVSFGADGNSLAAYIVPRSGEATARENELRGYLLERLPRYMVPDVYVFLGELPLTPNGKLDRRALPVPERRTLAFAAPSTPAEQQLAEIWAAVLPIKTIGRHDNFFESGGDSISALQIVARARQAGIALTVQDIFRHQTIAELTVHIDVEARVGVLTHGPSEGRAPLTPIQEWFVGECFTHPEHWNQSVVIDLPARLTPEVAQAAVQSLLEHHDGLRLRFLADKDGSWHQLYEPAGEQPEAFECIDLSALNDADRVAAFDDNSARLHASLSLQDGPLFKAAWFDLGSGTRKLLLVAHHMVVDGVSWRILLDDLQTLCDVPQGAPVASLPPRTSSFGEWAAALRQYASSEPLIRQLPRWEQARLLDLKPLRRDHALGENQVRNISSVHVALTDGQTRDLRRAVTGAFRLDTQELLLTAVVRALAAYTSEPHVFVDVEGHGRETGEIGISHGELDLSRTVGWFTSLYPIALPVTGLDIGHDLDSVKRELRAIPGKGLGYGVLKYLNAEGREALRATPKPEVVFNYLGQFESSGAIGLQVEWEPFSRQRNAMQHRTHLLEIDAYIRSGRLHFDWSYSRAIHEERTMLRLADDCLAEVVALIEHCQKAGSQPDPADFPLVQLGKAQLDTLATKDVEDILPATPIQQGILFHSLWRGGQDVYVNQFCLELEGDIRESLLRLACEMAVERHGALRSSFAWDDAGQPIQVFERRAQLEWESHDWSALTESRRAEEFSNYLAADRARGFDLARAPQTRMTLVRTGGTDVAMQQYQLLWTHHHAILDGWSAAIVWGDIASCYATLLDGKQPILPRAASLAGYARWLRELTSNGAREFWTQLLKGYVQPLRLGVETVALRTTNPAESTGRQTEQLSIEFKVALEDFAKSHRVTANTLVQFAWGVLLSRYSGRQDVVFGTVHSGRPPSLPGSDTIVGLFINTLPVRLQLAPEQTIAELMARLQEQATASSNFQYCSLPEIQGWSDVAPGQPLFEHILVFENYPIGGKGEGGVVPFRVARTRSFEATNYALTGVVTPGRELSCELLYDRNTYADEAVRDMLTHWTQIVKQILMRPEIKACELEMLSPSERREQVERCTPARQNRRFVQPVASLWEQQAARSPEEVAVICGKRQLTYEELNKRANRTAHLLRELGVRPGTPVAICAERSPEMVVALLGVVKAGGMYVPLPPSYPAAQLSNMLQDAGVQVVLAGATLKENLGEQAARFVAMDEDMNFTQGYPEHNPPSLTKVEDPLYAIYTSGSTGRPKCAVVTHAGFNNLLEWYTDELSMTPNDRTLVISSFGFDLTQKNLFGSLLTGGKLVFPGVQYDPDEIRALMTERDVTIVNCTPTAFYPLVELEAVRKRDPFSTVRWVVLGGEPISSDRLRDWFQARNNRTRLMNSYGPTECTDVSVAHGFTKGSFDERTWTVIGTILPNCEAFVLGPEMNLVMPGVSGELYIGGNGVGVGYLNKPDLTAERFLPNPFSVSPGARLYRTGDVARQRPDGLLEYLGRIDRQIKVRGFRIEPGEVEAVLRRHHLVREAAVAARRSHDSGNEDLVAYLVMESELDDNTIASIRWFAESHLPPQMVPAAFAEVRQMPLSANGKLDREALLAICPKSTIRSYQGPTTSTEEILAGIWSSVLGVARVGIDDNFFELGGHSLLATRVISQSRRVFKVEIPISALFDTPTVRHLARIIEQQERLASSEPEHSSIRKAADAEERELLSQLEDVSETELDAIIAALSNEVGELAVQGTDSTPPHSTRNGHGSKQRFTRGTN